MATRSKREPASTPTAKYLNSGSSMPPPEESPIRTAGQQEVALHRLNERLADCISRDRQSVISALQCKIEVSDSREEVIAIEQRYSQELEATKKLWNEVVQNEGNLHTDIVKYKSQRDDLQIENQRLRNELDDVRQKLITKEIMLDRLMRMLEMSQHEKQKWELKCNEMIKARQSMTIEFEKVIVGMKDQCEKKLTEAVNNVKEEYERKIQFELGQRQNMCRQRLTRKIESSKATRIDTSKLMGVLKNSQGRVVELLGLVTKYEELNKNLQDEIKELENIREETVIKEVDISSIVEDTFKLPSIDVTDSGINLDVEISKYENVLESWESSLLDLSAEDGVGQPSGSTPTSRPGKRKLPFEGQQDGSAAPASMKMRLDKEGRSIEIENNSDRDQSLGGWQLQHTLVEGSTPPIKFTDKDIVKKGEFFKAALSGNEVRSTLLNSSGEMVASIEFEHRKSGASRKKTKK